MNREEFIARLPELVEKYEPALSVFGKIKNTSLLMIIGASGVGKTSVMKNLGLHCVPADTTRPIRPEEVDGKDYYFLTNYEKVIQDIKAGIFVQVAVGANGDLYATKADSYPEGSVGVMAVMADVVPIFRNLGFKATVSAFITPPSYDEWMRRISVHSSTDEQLKGRLAEALRSFEFALKDNETHFIMNDNIDSATKQITDLLNGKLDVQRELNARDAAQAIFAKLA